MWKVEINNLSDKLRDSGWYEPDVSEKEILESPVYEHLDDLFSREFKSLELAWTAVRYFTTSFTLDNADIIFSDGEYNYSFEEARKHIPKVPVTIEEFKVEKTSSWVKIYHAESKELLAENMHATNLFIIMDEEQGHNYVKDSQKIYYLPESLIKRFDHLPENDGGKKFPDFLN